MYRTCIAVAGLALLLAPPAASARVKHFRPIDTGWVGGNLFSVAASLGTVGNGTSNGEIGCWLAAFPDGTWGGCSAALYLADGHNMFWSCYTFAPTLLAAIASLEASSFLEFHYDVNTSECRAVIVGHSSANETAAP